MISRRLSIVVLASVIMQACFYNPPPMSEGSTGTVGTMTSRTEPTTGPIKLGADTLSLSSHIGEFTCAQFADQKVRCWGYNGYGHLGYGNMKIIGDDEDPTPPGDLPTTNVNLGGPAIQVTAGQEHSCALMETGKVRCWGHPAHHGYPEVDNAIFTPPGDVVLGGLVRHMSAHLGRYTCATLVNDDVRCWGENAAGQFGYGHLNSIGDDETPSLGGPVPF